MSVLTNGSGLPLACGSPMKLALGAAVLALATSGCLAGVPPLRIDGGFGAVGPAHGPDDARTPSVIGSLRAGVFPAQLWESAGGRTFDFGAGYGFDGGGPQFALHTGFAEADLTRPLTRSNKGLVFGVGISPRLAYDAFRDNFGGGIGLRLSLDLSRGSFVNEWFTDSGDGTVLAAAAFGQASFGFYAEASFVSVGPYAFGTGTVGLTCRLPAMGFIYL